MTSCRYDRDRDDYFLPDDGAPCRVDDYGDPTVHCTARRTCTQHIGRGDQTCGRCIARARSNLRWVVDLAALMLPQAMAVGDVNSEAANLAGPATSVEQWIERRVAMRSYLAYWHAIEEITVKQYLHAREDMEDDDEQHPTTVLTRWESTIREALGHDPAARPTLTAAATYLDDKLHHAAQHPDVDFGDLTRELRACKTHLESVIRNSHMGERGANCPECYAQVKSPPRLVKKYATWDTTGASDTWRCPRVPDHVWSEADYRLRVADEYLGNAVALTTDNLRQLDSDIKPGTVRRWASGDTPKVRRHGRDEQGRQLYNVDDVLAQMAARTTTEETSA